MHKNEHVLHDQENFSKLIEFCFNLLPNTKYSDNIKTIIHIIPIYYLFYYETCSKHKQNSI